MPDNHNGVRARLSAIPGPWVNVRQSADVNSADLGDLHVGDTATIFDQMAAGWWYVVADKGITGYVARQGGKVVFTALDAAPALRLKNPVACAHLISSTFGVPRDYDGDGVFDDIHEGLDITRAHADCTPLIRSCADGVVAEVSSVGDYGNHIKVKTTVGAQVYVLWLCHLERVFVRAGDVLKATDYVGVMGSTGNSTGIHVHINVQKLGATTPKGSPVPSVVDPEPLIDW